MFCESGHVSVTSRPLCDAPLSAVQPLIFRCMLDWMRDHDFDFTKASTSSLSLSLSLSPSHPPPPRPAHPSLAAFVGCQTSQDSPPQRYKLSISFVFFIFFYFFFIFFLHLLAVFGFGRGHDINAILYDTRDRDVTISLPAFLGLLHLFSPSPVGCWAHTCVT